jgi:aspartate ammonia-lyase
MDTGSREAALASGRGIIELIREKGMLTEGQISSILDPARIAGQKPE